MAWTPVFSDAFTNTAFTDLNTHNAAWTQDVANGTFRISNNGTSCGNAGSGSRAWLTTSPANNQACEVTVLGGAAATMQKDTGLVIRFTDGDPGNFWGGTGYSVFISADNLLHLNLLSGGGSHSELDTASYTPTSGDVLRMEATGSDISVLINGTPLIEVVDATHASGTVGLFAGLSFDDSLDMSLDDFVAYEASGGSPWYAFAQQ